MFATLILNSRRPTRSARRMASKSGSSKLHAESLESRQMFSVTPVSNPKDSVQVVGAVVVQATQNGSTAPADQSRLTLAASGKLTTTIKPAAVVVQPTQNGSKATPTGTSSVPVVQQRVTLAAGGFTSNKVKIILTK